ncbi:metalloregulator ArsR/SmtB family transcription factor, partial [Blastomonas sp. CCH2-A2]
MDMGTLFRALADDSRLRIMLLLQLMELSVGELAQVLDQSQPRVSRHVRILAEAGLAERHKEGSWVFLRPALPRRDHEAARLLDAFLRREDAVGEALAAQHASDRQQLQAIRSVRDARAADFFAQHAGEWDAIRSLHLPEAEVEAALAAMIGERPLGRLLDIGTGTGRM